jgi:predicted AAA+ superfamily ATPase
MERIKLPFTPGIEVESMDKDRGLKQIRDFAERGTRLPVVVPGPEGCGKTSWLRQPL